MPTRSETFQKVVYSILPQVDFFYVFLDNFDDVPSFIKCEDKIVINSSREKGELHSSGRFLPLNSINTPSVLIMIDDDIEYPENYVSVLVENLAILSGNAVVGVHGRRFRPPYQSYVTDTTCADFWDAQTVQTTVDEIGSGTCAFLSDTMNFNVREWAHHDANDIQLAIEAQNRGIPRICVKRPHGWLRPYATNQADSLWIKTKADSSRQTALMRSLMLTEPRNGASSIVMERAGL